MKTNEQLLMKIKLFLLIAFVSLTVLGCKTINGSRFYVSRVVPSAEVTLPSLEEDKAAAGEALDSVAATYGLADRRTSSRFENTLRYYVRSTGNRLVLEARVTPAGMIVVVVEELHPGLGKNDEFKEVSSAVRKALEQRFSYRVKTAR